MYRRKTISVRSRVRHAAAAVVAALLFAAPGYYIFRIVVIVKSILFVYILYIREI